MVDGILSDSYPIGNGVKQGPGVDLVLVNLAYAVMFDRQQGLGSWFRREILVWGKIFSSFNRLRTITIAHTVAHTVLNPHEML